MNLRRYISPAKPHTLLFLWSFIFATIFALFPLSLNNAASNYLDPRERVLINCPKCISYPLLLALPTRTPTKAPTIKVKIQYVSVKVSPEGIHELMQKYATLYGIPVETLENISRCESGFNPGANNGTYGGLFQFHPGTWISTRKRMGLIEDTDLRYDQEEAIKTAAYKMSQDGTGAWAQCSQ